jgi:hypothetical protein
MFFTSGMALAQTPSGSAAIGIQEAYLAKDDGKGQAGSPAASFVVSDVPIYAVVQLDSAASATVKMNLVAADVPGVRAETRVVSTSYTTKNGEDRVNFSGRPAGKWTPGKYRADIFINGKLVKYLAFEIRTTPAVVAGSGLFQPRSKPRPARTPQKN